MSPQDISLQSMAHALRFLAIDAVEAAGSGHPGMPMGMADVVTVLFKKHLIFSSTYPEWPNRDRFILSAGHGSMLLYGLLYLTGYKAWTLDDIKSFRQWGSKAAGHPEMDQALGIETTTGPLGQGLSNAVGMALAESLLKARYGCYDYKVYCLVGDGCLMEGLSQEAISFAGHLGLKNLIVLFDDNHISIDGPTSLATSENHLKRFEACGWNTFTVDGHNYEDIDQALIQAKESQKPTLVACRTQIGFGSPLRANTAAAHGAPLGLKEIAATRQTLNWPHEPFDIPEDIIKAWRHVGQKHEITAKTWLDGHHPQPHAETEALLQALSPLKDLFLSSPPMATRQASAKIIEALTQVNSNLVGGSADLTSSNLTKGTTAKAISADDYKGTYIHYGIREHAMAGIMNGLALSGFRPFGGTFLVFSDYLRPALRLSALMNLPVIYILTHDSIGLGEDGPTHQPIEHLASLRAIPHLQVYRPADALETLECWELILKNEGPSVLALSRQNLPCLRQDYVVNLCAKGGYIIHGDSSKSQLTLLASGSEVSLAIQVAHKLLTHNIICHVVSLPCIETFLKTPEAYQATCLPPSRPMAAIEAGTSFGWDRLLQGRGPFFGLDCFGASAPHETLYKAFGLDVDTLTNKLLALIKN